jgi:hypothetical protein
MQYNAVQYSAVHRSLAYNIAVCTYRSHGLGNDLDLLGTALHRHLDAVLVVLLTHYELVDLTKPVHTKKKSVKQSGGENKNKKEQTQQALKKI